MVLSPAVIARRSRPVAAAPVPATRHPWSRRGTHTWPNYCPPWLSVYVVIGPRASGTRRAWLTAPCALGISCGYGPDLDHCDLRQDGKRSERPQQHKLDSHIVSGLLGHPSGKTELTHGQPRPPRYFLTLTTFQPLYGRLSDIFGRKECLLFAYSVFGLGCLGCGLAGDIVQLCVARAVAGVGGGGMNAVVSILMTDLVPLRDRGLWQGYINMVYAAGVASGAPIGGLLADSLGWRVAFAGQFPLAVLAWLAVFWVLDLPRADAAHWTAKLRRVDFLGALALSAAAFVLLWGLDNGANAGWGRLVTVVPLALAPVLFGLFVFIEVRVAASPFAPGRVILDPPLLAAYGANFFGLASQMGVMFFIAMFYQAAMALSATQSGALFVPSTFFGLTGSLGAGLLIRKTGKFYGLSLVGYSVMMLGLVPLVLFSGAAVKSVTGVVIGMTIMSLGGSICEWKTPPSLPDVSPAGKRADG